MDIKTALENINPRQFRLPSASRPLWTAI